jgi:hypothetical protein
MPRGIHSGGGPLRRKGCVENLDFAQDVQRTRTPPGAVEREVAQEWVWRLRRSSANPLEE